MLKGQKVYLDLRDHPLLEKLELDIRNLGGTVEKFLSRETTYVITSKEKAVRQKNASQRVWSPTQRLVSGVSQKICSSTLSRGQKLLMRSNSLNGISVTTGAACDPVQFAITWNIPIVSIDQVLEAIKSSVSQAPGILCEKSGKSRKGEIRMRKLTGAFIKIEDVNCHYRPFYGELPSSPCINLHPVAGESIFNVVSKKLVPQSDAAKKISRTLVVQNERGYCECCDMYYPDVKEHLREPKHRLFAQNGVNFCQLDAMTSDLTLVNSVTSLSCDKGDEEYDGDDAPNSNHVTIVPSEVLESLSESRSMAEASDSKLSIRYSPSVVSSKLLSENLLDASGSKHLNDFSSQIPETLFEDMACVSDSRYIVKDLPSETLELPPEAGQMVVHSEMSGKDLRYGTGNPKNEPNAFNSQDFHNDHSTGDPEVIAKIIAHVSNSKNFIGDLPQESKKLLTETIANDVVLKEIMHAFPSRKLELLSEHMMEASGSNSSVHLELPKDNSGNYSDLKDIVEKSSSRTNETLNFKANSGSTECVESLLPAALKLLPENIMNVLGSEDIIKELHCEKGELLCDTEIVTTLAEATGSKCSVRDELSITHSHPVQLKSIRISSDTMNDFLSENCESNSGKALISLDVVKDLKRSGILSEVKIGASDSNDDNVLPETGFLISSCTETNPGLRHVDPCCPTEIQLGNKENAGFRKYIVEDLPSKARDSMYEFQTTADASVSNKVEDSVSVTLALLYPSNENSPFSKPFIDRLAPVSESRSTSGTVTLETARASRTGVHEDGLLLESTEHGYSGGWIQNVTYQSIEGIPPTCESASLVDQVVIDDGMELEEESEPINSVSCSKFETAFEIEDHNADALRLKLEHQSYTWTADANIEVSQTMENLVESVVLRVAEETVTCHSSKAESGSETNELSTDGMVRESDNLNCSLIADTSIELSQTMENLVESVVLRVAEEMVTCHSLEAESGAEFKELCMDEMMLESDNLNCSLIADTSIELSQTMENLVESVVLRVGVETVTCHSSKAESGSEAKELSTDGMVLESDNLNCSLIADTSIELSQTMENLVESVVLRVAEETVTCHSSKTESGSEAKKKAKELSTDGMVLESDNLNCSLIADTSIELSQTMENLVKSVVLRVSEETVSCHSSMAKSGSEVKNSANAIGLKSSHQNCSLLADESSSVYQAIKNFIEPVVLEVEKETIDFFSLKAESEAEFKALSTNTMVLKSDNLYCSLISYANTSGSPAMENFMEPVVLEVEKIMVDFFSLKAESCPEFKELSTNAMVLESDNISCSLVAYANTAVTQAVESTHKFDDNFADTMVHESECQNCSPLPQPANARPISMENCVEPVLRLVAAEPTNTNPRNILHMKALENHPTTELPAGERITADSQAFLSVSYTIDTLPASRRSLPIIPSFEMCSSEGNQCSDESDLISSDRVDNILAFLSDSCSASTSNSSDCTMPLSPGYLSVTDTDDIPIRTPQSFRALNLSGDMLEEDDQKSKIFALASDDKLLEIFPESSVETRVNFNNDQHLGLSDMSSAVDGKVLKSDIRNDNSQLFAVDYSSIAHHSINPVACGRSAERETAPSCASIGSVVIADGRSELAKQNNKCTKVSPVHHFIAADREGSEDFYGLCPTKNLVPVDVVSANGSSCRSGGGDECSNKYAKTQSGLQEYSKNVVTEDSDRCIDYQWSSVVTKSSLIEKFSSELTFEDRSSQAPGLKSEMLKASTFNLNCKDNLEFINHSSMAAEWWSTSVTGTSGLSKYPPEVLLVDDVLEQLPIDVCSISSNADIDRKVWFRDTVNSEQEVSEMSDKTDIYSPSLGDEKINGLLSDLAIDNTIERPSLSICSMIDTSEVEQMDFDTSTFQLTYETTGDVVESQTLCESTTEALDEIVASRARLNEMPHVYSTSYCRQTNKMRKSDSRAQFRQISSSPYKSIANHANDVIRELELLERLAAGLVGEKTSASTSNRPLNIGVHDALLSLAGESEFDQRCAFDVFNSPKPASDCFDEKTRLQSDSLIDSDFFSKLLQDCGNIPGMPSEPFLLHSPRNSSSCVSVENCERNGDTETVSWASCCHTDAPIITSDAFHRCLEQGLYIESDSNESLFPSTFRECINFGSAMKTTANDHLHHDNCMREHEFLPPISTLRCVTECSSKCAHYSMILHASDIIDFSLPYSIGDSCKHGLCDPTSTTPYVESRICSKTNDDGVWEVQAIIGLRMRLKRVAKNSVLSIGSCEVSAVGCSDWHARRRSSTGLKLVISMPRAPSTDQMRIC